MTQPPAIVVDDLTRTFGATIALDGVSFSVRPGEVVALLGHNGAGKTTLLRVLNGLLRPTSGSVTTLGMDPVAHGQQVRARTGVLTEYPALDDFLTARENLLTYGRIYGVEERSLDGRISDLLHLLDLADRRDVACRDLSAGLRQRVALARALLHGPDLLLLDEPTSNLDPLAARAVRRLVVDQARVNGTTVLVSTHNLAEAGAIADRVVVLRAGRVLAVGPLRDLAGDHSGGSVVTLHQPTDRDRALHHLAGAGIPASPTTGPGSLTLAPTTTPAVVVRMLVEAGIDVAAVVPRTPDLEDVYVRLHQDPRHGGDPGRGIHARPPMARLEQP